MIGQTRVECLCMGEMGLGGNPQLIVEVFVPAIKVWHGEQQILKQSWVAIGTERGERLKQESQPRFQQGPMLEGGGGVDF